MALVNEHFLKLPNNYFFSDLEKKVNSFKVTHPKADLIRLGTGVDRKKGILSLLTPLSKTIITRAVCIWSQAKSL